MIAKFILLPAILLSHIAGGEFTAIYDIPGPHWFNSSQSCQSVAEAGNQNLRSGKGVALHITSVQSYFSCKQVNLDKSDQNIVQ
ncbi:hypothetical protein FAI41_00785 [Acetobacteraceae bacterium]|nr:hypothetical protein FAI41_00785 [Acetobacteraceae bacterium]